MKSRPAWIAPLLAGLLVGAACVAALAWWWSGLQPSLTEEQVRTAVVSTLQREAAASFLVTGTLDLMATATVENTRLFLPNVLDVDLGTTAATVRMPGRVSYGFDVRSLRPESVQLRGDGVVAVTLPPLDVYAVEPDLQAMEVETSVGWARLYRSSGRRTEQRAVQVAERALRQQAEAHLGDAVQPRVHTAEALEALLTPILQGLGIDDPTFHFQLGPELVFEPDAGER